MKKYLFLGCLFCMIQMALAQTGGTLRGKVTDENFSNESVVFADVAVYKSYGVEGLELELIDGSSTDENGDYNIPNIPAGTYIIEVTHIDFPRAIRVVGVQTRPIGGTHLDIKYPIIDRSQPPTKPYEHHTLNNGLFIGKKIVRR